MYLILYIMDLNIHPYDRHWDQRGKVLLLKGPYWKRKRNLQHMAKNTQSCFRQLNASSTQLEIKWVQMFASKSRWNNSIHSSNCRLISLILSFSKVAETIALARLAAFTNANYILPDFQYSFCRRHGCRHQLRSVTEILTNKLNRDQSVALLLLDVRQALDGLLRQINF